MKLNALSLLGFLLLGCFFQGCTSDLWEEKVCKPAPDTDLKLYRVGDDVMVQYNEVRERDGHLWRRNFFLNANKAALAAHRAPVFFDAKKEQMVEPIPLFITARTNAMNLPIYATSKLENGDPFFLVRNGARVGLYGLPVYTDPHSVTAGKILLTPAAVAGDAAAAAVVRDSVEWSSDDGWHDHLFAPAESPKSGK